jgi:hypothetical protein
MTEHCSTAGSQAQGVCPYLGKGVGCMCAQQGCCSDAYLCEMAGSAVQSSRCRWLRMHSAPVRMHTVWCTRQNHCWVRCNYAAAGEAKLHSCCYGIHASDESCSVCTPVIAVASHGCRQVPACSAPGGQQVTQRSSCVVGCAGQHALWCVAAS